MLSRKYRLQAIPAILTLLALACILPGAGPAQDIPASDPAALSTIIAGTANAAATQTALAATNTPSPTPTETATPTGTTTPTPRLSAEGTSLSRQGDGSFIFTDQQAGYTVVTPPGWLVVRINEQEYLNAWGLPEASDPKVQHLLNQFQTADPKVFRLVAADVIAEHLQGNFLTNFTISWDRNSALTLQQEIDQAKQGLPQAIAGAKVTYADVGATSTHISMAILEVSWSSKDASGQPIKIYQKIIGFKARQGTLAFTLTTTPELKDALLGGFDAMTDQIRMLP
jgi:hypothetical protein